MKHQSSISRTVRKWWTEIEQRKIPEPVVNGDPVTFIRERILLSLFLLNAFLCPFALIPALYVCSMSNSWGIIFLDIVAYGLITISFYARKYPLQVRALIICFAFCMLGTGLMFRYGPPGIGYVWLFGASVMAGAMIGLRAGLLVLLYNILVFILLTIYVQAANPLWVLENSFYYPQWGVRTVIFLMLNLVVTITIGILFREMEIALINEKANGEFLQKSKERYRLLADNVSDVIWTMDTSRRFSYISPSAFFLRGYTAEETMGQTMADILAPESLVVAQSIMKNVWRYIGTCTSASTVIELKMSCRDGSAVWTESTVTVIYDTEGHFREVLGVTRNIDARKKAEMAKSESEKRFRAIFEAAKNVSFIISDYEGDELIIKEVNPGAESIFGYSGDEMVGKPVNLLFPDDDIQKLHILFNSLNYIKSPESEEGRFLRKNGEQFPAFFSIYPLGKENDKQGAFLFVCIDISEHRKIEQRLIESEKMAALGGLVAGLVHEISTPLGIALTSSSYLKDRAFIVTPSDGSFDERASEQEAFIKMSKEATDLILMNIQRTVDLIDSFKQVAVDQAGDILRIFNVNKYIHNILLSLQPGIKNKDIRVVVDCPEDLVIESYPGILYQIFSNMIVNTVTHGFSSDETGEISILVYRTDNDFNLEYRDNGKGISPHNLEKIFTPFYTTRRNSGGSGLGLHIVHEIVLKRLKGKIDCFSQHGDGVLFTIKIPLTSPALKIISDGSYQIPESSVG